MKDITAPRTIVLVGNAHIDMIYRWRLNETLGRVIPDTFRGVLDVMDHDPELTYAQSQFALYETVKERYPDLWHRIRERVAEGRWIVVGGKWVEADSMLPGGESIVRQFLLGRMFAEEELGLPAVRVAWIPDCFGGHCNTTPQIYAGCGIEYYVFNRGCPDDMRCFHWKAPDGTMLFAYKIPEHYNLEITPELEPIVDDWCRITGLTQAMVLYGEGDHGGGPRDDDLDKVRDLREHASFSHTLTHGRPEPVLASARDARDDWPVFTGDIGLVPASGVHRGAHISQARIKHWNRVLEHTILQAERLAVLGTLCQRKFFFPRYDLTRLWKAYLLHQFHDTLPGTLVGDAADDVLRDFEEQFQEAVRIRTFGLEAIGARIDTRGAGVPVAVYNASAWPRSGIVEVQLHRPTPEPVSSVTDDAGNPIAFEADQTLRIFARDVPSLGFRLYRVHTGSQHRSEAFHDAVKSDLARSRAENSRLSIAWNAQGLVDVTDRRTGISVFSGTGNVPLIHEESESSSWHVSLSGSTVTPTPVSGPDIVCDSPSELRVRWVDRSEDSLFTRDVVLTAGAQWVSCELTVDWHDADRLLTIDFPTTFDGRSMRFEAPYGWVDRERDGSFLPMQRWCALRSPRQTLAVLNDGLYSVGGVGNTIRLAIVRGARDMDPRMDEGRHTVRYAVMPLEPDAPVRSIVQAACEFNEALLARQETRHPGQLPDWGSFRNEGALESPYSFCAIEASYSLLSVLKIVEGDWNPIELIVRIHETDGIGERVSVRLPRPLEAVVPTDHIEREQTADTSLTVDGSSFSFDIRPHAIRTFRIVLESGVQGG